MLQNTFIHIPGVGPKRQLALYDRGIRDWHTALHSDLSFMGRLAEPVKSACRTSIEKMADGDILYFTGLLPASERWRLWPVFKESCAYLDIETDPYRPTVVGIYRDGEYRYFLRGRDMDELPAYLRTIRFYVTYFGSGFDVPVLRKYFGAETLQYAAHLDLMHVLHSMGIRGGLKSSEIQLGLRRPESVAGMSGDDAVFLWNRYKSGNTAALETLIQYNREDVVNLQKILDIIIPRLSTANAP